MGEKSQTNPNPVKEKKKEVDKEEVTHGEGGWVTSSSASASFPDRHTETHTAMGDLADGESTI